MAKKSAKKAAKKSTVKKSVVKNSAAKKTVAKKAAIKRAARKSASAQTLVDEQLARYRSMRNFGVTAEPSGSSKAKTKQGSLPFVIQKHAASHLHYDFRLGWNGVLKSWAVAKGPSYYTGDKRLAVEVEDHPIEYGGFEGIIPKGQYGGGTVMVWDQGTWEPHVDVDEGLKNGSLKFAMHGTKMKGNWTLVRMKNSWGKKPNWLLIKEHDEYERGKDDPCVTVEEPNSAVTGRTLEEIADAETHVWQSNRTNSASRSWHHGTAKKEAAPAPAVKKNSAHIDKEIKGLPKEKLPEFIAPQLAQHIAAPPVSDNWLYELKLDGYRIQARKAGDRVQLFTRSGLDWTHRMRDVAEAIKRVPVQDAIFDGEVVVLDANGNSSFAKLQASFEHGEKHPFHYFVFDLLHLNGVNLRDTPLRERKELLSQIVPANDAVIQFSGHVEEDGEKVFKNACDLHAEGVIAKRADAAYRSGRSANWLKLKCVREQEFVIGGYTYPGNGTYGIGSLLLGYYQDGKLIYAGRTGTGFNQRTHKLVRDKLDALLLKKTPFDSIPREAMRDAHWVKPQLVAQVHFATWTADNLVRQAAFLGLREDKAAKEVAREAPANPPKPRAARAKKHIAVIEEKLVKPETSSVPVRLTHPDKVLDEVTHLTKQELAAYYWAVADRMLPHIANRPLSLVRCPEGSGKPCFFQKHVNHMLPPGIGSVMVKNKKTGEAEPYITLDTKEALAGLAQMGVLEVHPWGSKNKSMEKPDRIVIDLDPDPSIKWAQLVESAKSIHRSLKKIGLESFLKTTGGKGLHLVIPIAPVYDWPTVKNWARAFAAAIEESDPDLYLIKMSKAARKGKIFIDYLRNERGATAVAPFSPRAREGVSVSMPLKWSELKDDVRQKFSVRNFEEWKKRLKSDPWQGIDSMQQRLPGLSEENSPKAA